MKITLSRSALSEALARVGRVVKPRQTIAVLANVLLRTDGDDIEFVGTNLDIQITARVSGAKVEVGGAITLPGQALSDIARKIADGDVTMELDGPVMIVRSGRSRFRVPTIPADTFPNIGGLSEAVRFTLPPDHVRKLFGKTEFAMIKPGPERPYLQGVYLHPGKGRLVSAATNGHHLASVAVEQPDGAHALAGIIVPGPTVSEILKMVGDDLMAFAVEPGAKIVVTVGATTLVSKLLDAEYPDYERAFPTTHVRKALMERSELVTCIDRAMIALDGTSRLTRLALSDDRLIATATNSQAGMECSDEIRVEHDGEFTIGVNGSYLRDIAGQIDGDTLEMSFGDDAMAPILIRDPASDTARFVLLPMRL